VTRIAETPYTETEVLLAVMNSDGERAAELLKSMTLTELETLESQVGILESMVFRAANNLHPNGTNRIQFGMTRERTPAWAELVFRKLGER